MFDFEYCSSCGNKNLVQTSHEIICNYCGLVLMDRIISNEPEYNYHMECLYEDTKDVFNKQVRDVIDLLHAKLHIPESICNFGASLFQTEKEHFKNKQQIQIICAFIYFAQRSMHHGVRGRDEICTAMLLDPKSFNRACTQVKDVLFQNQETRYLMQTRENKNDSLHRLIEQIDDIPSNMIQEVKRIVYKLHDKIEHNSKLKLKSISIIPINVTLIYMACQFAKLKVTMTKVATNSKVSIATIIKIEHIVKHILMNNAK